MPSAPLLCDDVVVEGPDAVAGRLGPEEAAGLGADVLPALDADGDAVDDGVAVAGAEPEAGGALAAVGLGVDHGTGVEDLGGDGAVVEHVVGFVAGAEVPPVGGLEGVVGDRVAVRDAVAVVGHERMAAGVAHHDVLDQRAARAVVGVVDVEAVAARDDVLDAVAVLVLARPGVVDLDVADGLRLRGAGEGDVRPARGGAGAVDLHVAAQVQDLGVPGAVHRRDGRRSGRR